MAHRWCLDKTDTLIFYKSLLWFTIRELTSIFHGHLDVQSLVQYYRWQNHLFGVPRWSVTTGSTLQHLRLRKEITCILQESTVERAIDNGVVLDFAAIIDRTACKPMMIDFCTLSKSVYGGPVVAKEETLLAFSCILLQNAKLSSRGLSLAPLIVMGSWRMGNAMFWRSTTSRRSTDKKLIVAAAEAVEVVSHKALFALTDWFHDFARTWTRTLEFATVFFPEILKFQDVSEPSRNPQVVQR